MFVELCGGLGAMSLALQHGRHCKPPVSRMGNKAGYSLALLRIMGLRPGQGAESFLIAEPDPGCRALLHAYTDPALMRAAADIIRGWKDEEPRALWTRLRAEGPIKDFGAREVGRFSALAGGTFGCNAPRWDDVRERWEYTGGITSDGSCTGRPVGISWKGPEAQSMAGLSSSCTDIAAASELARYLQVTASNRLVNIDSTTMQNSGKGGATFGGSEFATPAETVSEAAREVARHVLGGVWSYRQSEPDSGFVGPGQRRQDTTATATATATAKVARAGGLPATIVEDARDIHPPPLPDGCVVYLDGPYEDTTGYGHLFPRAEQVEVIRRWDEAGAACYVSEAEPIPELVEDGWHAVEITSTRIGQKRTFSKQKREWVTMNRPPAWVPAIQQGLFG